MRSVSFAVPISINVTSNIHKNFCKIISRPAWITKVLAAIQEVLKNCGKTVYLHMQIPQPCANTFIHTTVWLLVQQWAYKRPQLAVSDQAVKSSRQPTTTKLFIRTYLWCTENADTCAATCTAVPHNNANTPECFSADRRTVQCIADSLRSMTDRPLRSVPSQRGERPPLRHCHTHPCTQHSYCKLSITK